MCKDNTNKTGRQWQVDATSELTGRRYYAVEEPQICGHRKNYVRIVAEHENGPKVILIPLGRYMVKWHEIVQKRQTWVDVATNSVKEAMDEVHRRTRNEARQRDIGKLRELIENANEKIEALRRSME